MFHIGPEANEISRRALEPAAQILRGVVVQYTNRCEQFLPFGYSTLQSSSFQKNISLIGTNSLSENSNDS